MKVLQKQKKMYLSFTRQYFHMVMIHKLLLSSSLPCLVTVYNVDLCRLGCYLTALPVLPSLR